MRLPWIGESIWIRSIRLTNSVLRKHLLVDIKDGVSIAKWEPGGSTGGIFTELRDFYFQNRNAATGGEDFSFTCPREDWGLPKHKIFFFWKLWKRCYHRGCTEQNLKCLLMFCKHCCQEVQEGCWMEECFSSYLFSLSANDFEEGGWWIEYVQELIFKEIQVSGLRLLENHLYYETRTIYYEREIYP